MRTLHLVSHTHWDREWYLTFQQFRSKLVHLIDGLLDLFEKEQDYKYFMLDGQTIILDDYLLMRPENEKIIQKLIRSGRLIIGPWYVLPDMFLVSPEAHIRNLLQGDRMCKRFGSRMAIGYLPDPFGHFGQVPQILCGFDIQTAAFRRGLSDEPCEVWWCSPDGSRVFTAYLRDGYGNAAGLPVLEPDLFVNEVRRLRDNLLPHTASSHLLLMQGTDHMEPIPGTANAIQASKGILDGDILIHSNLSTYLEAVRSEVRDRSIPSVYGELRSPKRHHLLPGVLSTRMWIKQRNHLCENLLEKWAEPYNSFSEMLDDVFQTASLSNRSAVIRQAWRLLMENHPHDSICGCSIDQVHEEMRTRFDQVEQIGEEVTRQSLDELAARVDSRSPMKDDKTVAAVIVFNPCSSERSDVVTVDMTLPPGTTDFELLDPTGEIVPYQTEGLGSRDLTHITMDRKGLSKVIGSLGEGRVIDLSVQNIEITRKDDTVTVKAIIAENVPPNLEAWDSGMEQIKELLKDLSITTFNIHARTDASTRLTFTAGAVPGLGWKTFRVRRREEKPPVRLGTVTQSLMPILARLGRSPFIQRLIVHLTQSKAKLPIENDYFRLDVSREGTLNLYDKQNHTHYCGLNRFVDSADCGDEYNFNPLPGDTQCMARLKRIGIHSGRVTQSIELELALCIPSGLSQGRAGRSRRQVVIPIHSRVTLVEGVPRVDIRTSIENKAWDHRLRVHFRAPIKATSGDHDGHFEVVRRRSALPVSDETWEEQPRPEVPQRAFTDISDGKTGLMIANRGLPEVEVLPRERDTEMAVTLLRCVGWLSRDDLTTRKGHAGPFLPTPGAQMAGKWIFEYSIIPHSGDWKAGYRHAYAFETPLQAVITGIHDGTLAASGSFLCVEEKDFVISAVKRAENGTGWLVRGYNILGRETQVHILPGRKFKRADLVNLSERRLRKLSIDHEGWITFTARGHEIVSLILYP